MEMAFRRVLSPVTWKVGTRRAFLLTAPVSVPLWIVLILGFTLLMAVRSLWNAIAGPISELWNAPPKRIRTNGVYSYSYGRRPHREEVADLEAHREKRDAA
jgi:hypothetical protein